MYLIFIMLFSIVLAALSAISFIRNFLISFNVSDSGWKTIKVAVLLVICLLSAVLSYTEAFTVKDINFTLSSAPLSATEIDVLSRQVYLKTIFFTFSICIGYIAYFIHLRILNKIKEDKLKQIEINSSNSWSGKVQL